MAIWRVTVDNIKANRKDSLPTGMTVEVKPSLTSAGVEKAGEVELVKAGYKLSCKYQPDFGQIEVSGNIYFIDVDPKKILKDGKIVDTEIIRQAYQRIFVEPVVIAIGIAKELLLPLPIKMPEIKVEKSAAETPKKK
ncbi:MAG: hypothetical protein GOU98_01740 [Candidatus Altiarchaeota archaeon]|nr:hypothetical protein [Candidatus Altiarchaeota archaeon]